MERLLFTLAWYAALLYGAKRVYTFALGARKAVDPLVKARQAASAFFVCGQVLWAYAVLDDARREINFTIEYFAIGDVLGVIGGAIGWAIFLMGPTWLPLRLLSGAPSPMRCGIASFIARAVAFFAGACMAIAPFMFLFASSFGEYVSAILTVAIPLLILIYVALKVGSYASRAGDALDVSDAGPSVTRGDV